MTHNFIKKTCINCGLKRTKVNATTREYKSGEKWEWRYYMPDDENTNITLTNLKGRCSKS